MKFYDAHTHSTSSVTDLRNVIFGWDEPHEGEFCTVGAHPLFYEKTEGFYEALRSMCNDNAVLAVGECGMDKRSPLSLPEQVEVFMTHVKVSEELKKPLVIHCVGHFNELSNIYREASPSQMWVIHGFRKNPILASQLASQGFYFSMGIEGVRREGLLGVIPLEHLLFETDETADITIEDVYREAAAVLGMDIEELARVVEDNFFKIFHRSI